LSDQLQTKWDERYAKNNDLPQACRVLQEFSHLLPSNGQALDLACGLGGNALLLAKNGLAVTAWDLSPIGIEKLAQLATQASANIEPQVRDVIVQPPEKNSFDVIVVSYFLERKLFPALLAGLKPSGLLFYETFITDKLKGSGPSNPDYCLQQNELLRRCDGLIIRSYREEGMTGNTSVGLRNVAMLVGQNS